MTNREKFIEVFHAEPDETVCPIYCSVNGMRCAYHVYSDCYSKCVAGDWWKIEYKEKGTDQ